MPTGASSYAHTGTPTMVVSDARGLLLRTVQFHRREAADPVDTRVTQQCFDAAGRLTGSRDPYLFDLAHTDASTPFNLSQVTSLSGGALMTDSVDAGWRVVLPGDAGQPLEHWDGRGSHSLTEYDELLRSVAVHESGREVAEHTLERFTYADASAESAARNLCGQPIRHDDPAGTVHVRHLNITGNVLSHTRKFLTGTDAPDWPADVARRDALLEPGDGATTAYTFASGSELLSQTDAFGNVQAFAHTVDGLLKNTKLTLAGTGQIEKLLVSAIHYNVTGQIEAETAGNGIITRHRYDEANGRLTELSAHKADGTPLQDLKYCYDAVGNVLSIEDAAQPILYFNNQRIESIKTYRYNTLYELIEATGCEAKTGPALPDFQSLPLDSTQIANYTQTFYYDAGGNLLDLVHVGAQAHGRTLSRARYSNRCLPERDNRPPTEDELAAGFDANGNLRELQAGQSLTWDLRNQLREVRPVVREDTEDDRECYVYDGGGQRVRKLHSSLTNARTVLREVRYLPGVEIRSHSGSGEILHVITASAGSNSVQVLHWVARQPQEVAQDQVRYSLGDHLKSSTLELDQHADLISQEWFYPFGGTAYWAGRDATEVKYKTVRYSGKERDATGLYYYGFRYYAPWLQRWINPDPAGCVDGMNVFSMVANNPIVFLDKYGNNSDNFNSEQYLENFRYLLDEDNTPSVLIWSSHFRTMLEHMDAVGSFESLSNSAQQTLFKQQIVIFLETLAKLPPGLMEDPEFNHYFTRLQALLVTAQKFEPFDDIPLPAHIKKTKEHNPVDGRTYREGKSSHDGYTYRSEQSSSTGESSQSRQPGWFKRNVKAAPFPDSISTPRVYLEALPPDSESAIIEGYEHSINIINGQNINTIFPDAKSVSSRYKRIAVLIHPDKLFLEGRPDVQQRATQAMKILNDWRDRQHGPPQPNSPHHRTQPQQ